MIRRIVASVLGLCIITVFCLSALAAEGVPQLINYQGRLTDAAGKPVEGTNQMAFEFYDAAAGGNLLAAFSETQQVAVTNGIFNVLIGSATEGGVPLSVFEGTSVYLSVTVEDEELSPRQRITSGAYAIRAGDAESLDGVPASDVHTALADLQARLSAFENTHWKLTIEHPEGHGTTNPLPGSYAYPAGSSAETLTVAAIPEQDWVFRQWEGTAVTANTEINPVSIEVGPAGQAKTLKAIFAEAGHLAPMCLVPAGPFTASTGDQVYLSAYYIDRYEVTNELYCQFLNSGGKDGHWHGVSDAPPYEQQIIRHALGNYSVAVGMEQRPVRHVNWHDAVAFVDWRSVAEDLPPGTYHLPTEAQWEKAAGWDPVQQKLWKYAIQSDTIDCDRVNYYCSPWVGRTTDVGSYPYTTFYGCYDMSGNVWEWCSDWYQSGAYPTSDSNPTGPGSGTTRALRGGYWLTGEASSRVGNRGARAPTAWSHIIGFRCAMTLE